MLTTVLEITSSFQNKKEKIEHFTNDPKSICFYTTCSARSIVYDCLMKKVSLCWKCLKVYSTYKNYGKTIAQTEKENKK